MKKINKYVPYAGSLWFLLGTLSASAQIPAGVPIRLSDISNLIFDVATFIIDAAGFIAVIMIIWNGIKYMMAGDDTSKVKSAQDGLKAAIIGSAIVFGIGVILATVRTIILTRSLG